MILATTGLSFTLPLIIFGGGLLFLLWRYTQLRDYAALGKCDHVIEMSCDETIGCEGPGVHAFLWEDVDNSVFLFCHQHLDDGAFMRPIPLLEAERLILEAHRKEAPWA